MNALELYKFVSKNELECHKTYDNDVILFIPFYCLNDCNKLLGKNITDDEGIDCKMRGGYLCFMMDDITAFFGIELNEVFDDKILTK